MTRKTSKMLALAVMGAILMGGYSGVNPVYAVDTNDQDISAGNITATGTITAANNKFQVKADGTLSAVDGKFSVDESNIKLGYLTINATNDGVKFTDTNRSDSSFTIADIISIKDRTQTVSTWVTSYGNVVDTYTSIGGKLKVYDTRKVGEGSETTLDLVTINEGKQNQVSVDTVDGIVISHQGNDDSATTAAMNEKGVFAGGKNYNDAKAGMSNADGSLKAASGKFIVNAKGEIYAADNKFIVDENGELQVEKKLTISEDNGNGTGRSAYLDIDGLTKLNQLVDPNSSTTISLGKIEAANESKIGGVTFSNGQLSVPYGTDTARVNVSDLAEDHDVINNDKQYTYSSKTVKSKIDSLEQASTTLGSQMQKIERFTNQNDGKEGTSIAGNLDVYDDGTVIINENAAQQVTIDSNGIKVGQGSAYINDDGFKAGADGKNSLTTVGLKAEEIRAGNNNTEFFVDGGGNVVAAGTLNAAGGNFDVSTAGDITAKGFLSVVGDKFRVNADGSINANNKFIVDKDGALRASDDKFTADKDGNVRAIGSLSAANTKFFVGTDGSINVNQKFIVDADGTISSEGTLSVAGGKFIVDADGVVTAGSVKMNADGKLTSASGSKIGDVTIDGESLSSGTASVKISELASDHDLVNDANKGNESLYTGLGSVQTLVQGLDSKTAGITRDTTGSATTTIEGTLDVGRDGTVKINEGDAQQVLIDSNGIKVGLGSAYMNSDGFKVGADGKNSLTSSGLNAKTLHAGTNNTEFTVDENGNVVAKGKLSAADGNFIVAADGTVTTKKLITDELVITGSGTAGGSTGGSIAFGGSGTIKSNIKEGSKETTFETTVDGVNTKVTDGTNTTKVTTAASGTTFTDETNQTNHTETKINGSSLISSKSTTDTGTLDGSNLTLAKGDNQTDLSAGGATFTKNGKTTTIDGGNISTNGTLSVAGGNFTVDADGSFSAAGGKFKIDETGTITAGSIKMDKIEASDDTKGIDVGGVVLKDKSITAADGKFKVDTDGTVMVNEGTKNQVRIDSNGIKVGNNSAFISDDGFKSSGDLYIGTKTAPTEAATDARFYVKGSDGSVKAADGKFTVEADGGFTAADGKFRVDGDGNLEVKDAAGNSKSINLSEMADMSQDVARMNNRISDVSDRVNKVGAMSAAIASLKTIGYDPEAPTEFSVGLGQYKSETGLALGIFHYPNRNVMFNLSLSTSGGETMGGIGATWRIGHGASQKQMEVTVQEDVEKVIVKKEDYEALQAQVNQLSQVVQQLVAEKEARNS